MKELLIIGGSDAGITAALRARLERHGITVRIGSPIETIERVGDKVEVPSAGSGAQADMVLVATGVRPSVALGQTAGLAVGERGALRVSSALESSVADVYAAGDCVETRHRLTAGPAYLPLGTTAHKQGRVAGENAVGARAVRGQPRHASRESVRLGHRAERVPRRGRAAPRLRTSNGRNEGLGHKAYYPGATEMRLRVTGDRRTGRLLGAQVLGSYGAEVSKRLDIFAAAIVHGMRVDAVEQLDLSYTPPLSSPWDPVQTSCMEWAGKPSEGRA
jgi:NADPH-dependent 2,4-dienoyl-CoA reductase/sulfur reductase-like enzyme